MNPGSLISCFSLFVATQLQHGQCAFPNSLLLFVQSRGVFLGACTFIIAVCSTPIPNAVFGSSFWSRRPYLAVPSTRHSTALLRFPCKHCAGRGCGGWGGLGGRSGLRVGGLLCLHWFALLARFASLHCLPAWFAALCLLSVVSALAGLLYPVTTGTLFWFVFGQPRATALPLGLGG